MQFLLLILDWGSILLFGVLVLYGMIMVWKRHLLFLEMSIQIFSLESRIHFFKIFLDDHLLLHIEFMKKWARSTIFLSLLALVVHLFDICRFLILLNRSGIVWTFLNEEGCCRFDIFQVFVPSALLHHIRLHLDFDALYTRFLIQYLYFFLWLLLFQKRLHFD